MTECPICFRQSMNGTELCEYHEEALTRLRAAFAEWEKALGVGWIDYLSLVYRTQELGLWVREIVAYLTSRSAASMLS